MQHPVDPEPPPGAAGSIKARTAARADLADGRDTAADHRDQAADDRDDAGDRRDDAADERDAASGRRDDAATRRDVAADRRDAQAASREEHADAHLPPTAALASSSRRASAARDAAASDRHLASHDRSAGASERESAEQDRTTAQSDRSLGATERHQAGDDRGASALDREDASLDGLTGTYVRRAGLVQLERELVRAQRLGQQLVVAFVDVDGLKAVNDEGGHAAGDRLLVRVAQALRDRLRSYDLVVRYGGDEFVCVLPGASVGETEERFLLVNEDLASCGSVTAGVASVAKGDDVEAILARADAAMYARRAGRP